MLPLFLLFLAAIGTESATYPLYPVTASWFKDRFDGIEWAFTLEEFAAQGGDAVWQRGQEFMQRTYADVLNDPNFPWCGDRSAPDGVGGNCLDQAGEDLKALGLTVGAWVTYQYEEAYSGVVMRCPAVDLMINSSRIYYRLILPIANQTFYTDPSDSCSFAAGSSVAVLFTSFAGVDPHALLLGQVAWRNTKLGTQMVVYPGLPSSPLDNLSLMPAYLEFVSRVLADHQSRFTQAGIWQYVAGYYSTDEVFLGQLSSSQPVRIAEHSDWIKLSPVSDISHSRKRQFAPLNERSTQTIQGQWGLLGDTYLTLYQQLGQLVHTVGKLFVLSPYVDANLSQVNVSLAGHTQGFIAIANTGVVDVIAVQEGRGCAKGSYWWPYQAEMSIDSIDEGLDKIVRYLDPTVVPHVLYSDQYTTSNQALFASFAAAVQTLNKTNGITVDVWANLEAFEYLRDTPCLPVDIAGSGMAELIDRTAKSRIDWGLTVQGALVSKVISFAWDADYLCTNGGYAQSLAAEIRADYARPIVSSVTVSSTGGVQSLQLLGYNLQSTGLVFNVTWFDTTGAQHTTPSRAKTVHVGWGASHQRVPSLQQAIVPFPYINQFKPNSYVSVLAANAFHAYVLTLNE